MLLTHYVLILVAPALQSPAPPPANPAVDFDKQVRPLLTRTCFRCHGDEKQRGGLRLDQRAAALRGGDSGKPAVKPRDPAGSLLLQRLKTTDLKVRMPPRDDPALTPEEMALLERWIAEGANWSPGEGGPDPGKQEMAFILPEHDGNQAPRRRSW